MGNASTIHDTLLNTDSTIKLPQKIYTIWNGEYSDRHVECFCYTEDEAKRACAYLNDTRTSSYADDYYYEETDIYDGQKVEKACTPYEIRFSAISHGVLEVRKLYELTSVRPTADIRPIYGNYIIHCVYCGTALKNSDMKEACCPRCGRDIVYPKMDPIEYEVTIYTDADKERATKIACDALAKYLAEEEGL